MGLPNAFAGKPQPPTATQISSALGPAAPAWNDLIVWFTEELGITNQEWKSTSPKYGWTLILSSKKRRIVYLAPCAGCFRASLIIGDRAIAEAREAGLSKSMLKILDEAPHYPEGTAIRLMVKLARDLPPIRKFAQVKLAN